MNRKNLERTLIRAANKEKFDVVYSAHGGNYHFDGQDPERSTRPITLSEAVKNARAWEITANSVGGSALVVYLPKDLRMNDFNYLAQIVARAR